MVMIRYSLKQLWRMKRTCILFVLFLTFAVLLLTLGSSMYGLVSENMERMEALFCNHWYSRTGSGVRCKREGLGCGD